MNHVELIKRFLHNRAEVDIPHTGLPFVTVSRQAGAGGHTLGRDILRVLAQQKQEELSSGWELFDQKLCALLAQDPAFTSSFESLVEEKYKSEIHNTMLDMFLGKPQAIVEQRRLAEVILLLAEIGKVVIIGRGGMCITHGMPQGIHLRLVAPKKIRLAKMRATLAVSEKEAARFMEEQDRNRARMIKDFYNKDIDDPLLYDIIWNTGTVSNQEIATAVVNLIQQRLPKTPSENRIGS